jgi:crotonobetainyl-CoA:carnitine CoA-transferase CaiB-like acyl-CoA transferase
MQSVGVASAVVATGEDICNDPQLEHRRFLVEVDHPEIGRHRVRRQSFIMSKTPGEVRRPPLVGEHNDYVYTKLLGMSDEEFTQLMQEGVFE